jgi:AbrB family transcriptional regulator (stage V sporulation protein T)
MPKSIGIIVPIDDCYRITIPKEVRRTIHLHSGDQFELSIDRDGRIVLQKHSIIGKFSDIAQKCADTIYEITGFNCYITDKEEIISVAGEGDKSFGKSVDNFIKIKETINDGLIKTYDYEIIVPIVLYVDVVGVIYIFSNKKKVNNEELGIIKMAARFLAKQMED